MKILDSTTIIAILREICCPELIDKILRLNHELVIPSHVYSEILDGVSKNLCDNLVAAGKMRVSTLNSRMEIQDLQKSYPYLGKGEIDSMLQYDKLSDNNYVYCIFDDGEARRVAGERGIPFTGLLGLLQLLKNREIIGGQEAAEILCLLRNSNFRVPRGFVI